jgi:hypothetical protein
VTEGAQAGTAQGGVPSQTPAQDATLLERTMFEIKRVIVGQDRMVERMLVALLARTRQVRHVVVLQGLPAAGPADLRRLLRLPPLTWARSTGMSVEVALLRR